VKEAITRSKDQEIQGEKVSISPLEFLAQTFLSYTLGKYLRLYVSQNGQFVARCDNHSVCMVVDTGRP